MMRRAVLGVVALLGVLILLVLAGTAWIGYTEPGLRWSLARIAAATDGALTVGGATGTWAGGLSAARIEYSSKDLSMQAGSVSLALSPAALFRRELHVLSLVAERLAIRMSAGDDEAAGPPESLALPIRIDVASAHVRELSIERGEDRHVLRDVALSYAGGPLEHELRKLHAVHELATVDASGKLGARAPFPITAEVSATVHEPLPGTAGARLTGSLQEMTIAGTASDAAARAQIEALVRPFAPQPVESARIEVYDVDLRRYVDTLPQTRIAAELSVRPQDGKWTGPLRITNALHGPWDRQRLPVAALTANVALDPESAKFDDLQVNLGAGGAVSGSATVRRDTAAARLATQQLNLRGLHSQLRATELKGHAALELAADKQSASGVLKQEDIELAFDAQRDGDDVRVRRFAAKSRGGELRGEARLSLAGKRPYTASGVLSGFDPSAWGDFPRGSLNGNLKVAGALDGDAIRVQYALDGSRLLGSPLDGAGQFTYAGKRISDANVRLALGDNRVTAKGAFGAEGDRLDMQIAAPRLSAFDPGVSGAVTGTARLGGTWSSPSGTVDLSARRLAYGKDMRVDSLALNGELTSLEQRAFRLTARAQGVTTPAWKGERVAVSAEGTQAAHALRAQARGGDLDLELEARGGWMNDRWSGVVARLENRGEIRFQLASPVDVAIAEHSVRLGPFAATLMEGKLDVGGLQYDNGAITSRGRFSSLPVRPLMALAGLATRPRDTLRLTGSWAVDHAPSMTVDFTVQRESGDITLGQTRPLALGLEALRVEGRLVNDRVRMTGTLRSALASADASATVATVQGRDGPQIASGSPVEFSASAEIARLAAFAGLFDNTTAYFDGRLRANLAGRGTLGKPVVTGTIEGERLAVALPPEGVDLSGGMLRARVADNRIAVDQFSIQGGEGTLTAQGTLSLVEGQRASVDWRADRLRILGRPDRRLVVTGSGNATLDGGKLALTGEVRANEGLFQFGATALPTLGPDVVVLGRAETQPKSAAMANARLRLVIDLGNDLHIVGQGLDAWIEGKVLLRTGPSGALLAEGTVNTQRGRYTAFGQRLDIDRGRLLFNGAVDNPGLDILAMRKNQAVAAGVAVTGNVNSPVVRIVSDPPVPEGEALSWLVLGRGPADASRADLAMLPLAAAALFGGAKPGEDSFASKLGLDTLSLRGSTTLANNVVAVGKRFSHNLYVAYEQSLGGVANVLKVELNLTRRFLLRAETGEVSAAGLFFRYAFD